MRGRDSWSGTVDSGPCYPRSLDSCGRPPPPRDAVQGIKEKKGDNEDEVARKVAKIVRERRVKKKRMKKRGGKNEKARR